jgi:hypothetical protein
MIITKKKIKARILTKILTNENFNNFRLFIILMYLIFLVFCSLTCSNSQKEKQNLEIF